MSKDIGVHSVSTSLIDTCHGSCGVGTDRAMVATMWARLEQVNFEFELPAPSKVELDWEVLTGTLSVVSVGDDEAPALVRMRSSSAKCKHQ
jgi:hypothetical protein